MSVAEENAAGFTSAGQLPSTAASETASAASARGGADGTAQASTLAATHDPVRNPIAKPSSPPSNLVNDDSATNQSHHSEIDTTSLSNLRAQRQISLERHRVAPQPAVSPNPAPDSEGASSCRPGALDTSQTNHRAPDLSSAAAFVPAASTAPATAPQVVSNSTTSSPPLGSSNNDIITSSPSAGTPHDRLQRSATYPAASPLDATGTQVSPHHHEFALSAGRRAPASRSSLGVETSDGPPLSLKTQRTQATEGSSSAGTSPTSALSPRDSGGQRELLLLKSLANSSPPDEPRRASTHRPPVSYKPPPNAASAQNANATPVRVPPIRSFRSSGSGKSITLDMSHRRGSFDVDQESPGDPNNYDRTLRALEGRQISDMLQMTPPTSARNERFDGDDGGDVFLKIAREEGARRYANEDAGDETRSSVSRVYRTHRRPLSTNVASYQPKSPPFLGRRLSDQQDNNRPRLDDERASEVTRSMTQRLYSRDQKAASVHPGEDTHRSRTNGGTLRASPLTPRSQAYQYESGPENPMHTRRRSSVTDNNSTPPASRSASYKPGNGHTYNKSYNSSPLVKSFDFNHQNHHQHDNGHGLEGTESTASTTAPSTVWDELDDLKSRIHRLELTGKLPSTSAAAVSRVSDERPPTATTTVTTMSSSPKRNGGGTQLNETTSTTSSQKEAYPILHSALVKSKPFLSADIFRSLEAAANEAMALSSMMGQPGQPGPISSGASTIGSGTTITDRQLRRKADSVCRSLTELAVALGEDVAHPKPQSIQTQKNSEVRPQKQYYPSGQSQVSSQVASGEDRSQVQYHSSTKSQTPQADEPSTPTINKTFSGLHSRRPSVVTEQNLAKPETSPSRIRSKFEERRNTILNGSALPSPRAAGSTPTTPQEGTAQRRSSLLISRTRRAVTEEPEEQPGRQSSLMLGRHRRGGTEEPEEGRQTSMLRNRRGTAGEGDDDTGRINAPSRAYTEINATRGSNREYTEVAASARAPTREYAPQSRVQQHQQPAQESPSTLPTALPRRRFVSTNTPTSRLPPPPSQSALPTRKYLERSPAPTTERETTDFNPQPPEDRRQRYYSLGQSMSLNRTGSLSTRRHNRDNTTTNSSATASTGAYR